jgi:hypothetical protein
MSTFTSTAIVPACDDELDTPLNRELNRRLTYSSVNQLKAFIMADDDSDWPYNELVYDDISIIL